MLAVLAGFSGVLIIVKPGFTNIELATYGMLGTAFCYAIATVTTKKLAMQQTPLTILLAMVVIQMPLSYLIVSQPWPAITPLACAQLLVVGLSALSAHYCFSRAMMITTAMTVVTIDYMRLPIMVLLGWLLYGELLDLWFWIGALLILTANVLTQLQQLRRKV